MLTLEMGRSVLSRKAIFTLAARTPGRYTDSDFPTLGLQVSPKGRAVWFARGKAPGGCEFRTTLGQAAANGDGLVTFDYAQAREWTLGQLQAAHRPPESARRQYQEGLPEMVRSRVKAGSRLAAVGSARTRLGRIPFQRPR